MITRIRIRNFKSFRELDLPLTDLNVLVGPNMSGKSNLLDAIRFLVQLLVPGSDPPLQKALNDRNGFSEVVWKGASDSIIGFEIEGNTKFGAEPLVFSYLIELTGNQYGYGSIRQERLHVDGPSGAGELISTSNNTRKMRKFNGTVISELQDPNSIGLQYPLPDWEASAVRNAISAVRFYNLVPPLMRRLNPSTAAQFLTEYGDNLSSWLMTLQTRHQAVFSRFRSVSCDVLPNLQDVFTFPTQQSTVFVSSQEKHLLRPIPLSQMSDGELVFLAWISLILSPPELGAGLYCIEEPENHLHPRLVDALFELLRQVRAELAQTPTDRAQLIVTTHSPYVIDKCDIAEIVVVQKQHGQSRCTRPSDRGELKELLKDKSISLGELYFSGALASA